MSAIHYLSTVNYTQHKNCCDSQMPRSRKRHHSRSRSKSRSLSRDKSHDKPKKTDSHEKDGKRRRLDDVDSPNHKRSISLDPVEISSAKGVEEAPKAEVEVDDGGDDVELEKMPDSDTEDEEPNVSDSESVKVSAKEELQQKLTPKKPLTPKQLQKKLESEKKKQQKQKEREERERQRQEEKAKALAEKQKLKEQKEAERQKLLEQKQKEKEMKEEQRKKEKEEKEQKRKEKEEMEAQKKRDKEMEKLKRQQEKEKEKEKEEEKKKKSAALFVNFFKKADGGEERERKVEKVNSNFMPFEVKSDMRLPPLRRRSFSEKAQSHLDSFMDNQNDSTSYLNDLKSGYTPRKSQRTWPYEDPEDDDEVTIVEDDKLLGETISEEAPKRPKLKAKLLQFHENRRPAYFGTWRKTTQSVGPRRPFAEDKDIFNYEEDSDDDWEEEEQGESLDESAAEEEEKEAGNDEDDYEVDNEFFVPHGHLSDDEVDDEETARLSPESMKQKLKLLKDEFDEDMSTKTRKLKPRSIGCVWYSKKGDNVEEAIHRYLQPFAALINGRIEVKKRSEIFVPTSEKKKPKHAPELPPEHVPYFLRIIQGNERNQKVLVEEFLTYMANNGFHVEVSKASLTRFLKQSATYKKCPEGPAKNKFGWFLNEDVKEKYGFKIEGE